jgi:hypothetical protein
MLIQSGRVSALRLKPWVAIELTSDAHTDEVVLHLIRWAVRHLEAFGKAFQLLYPVESRTLRSTMMLSPYLWMRVSNTTDLSRITSIQSIQGMVSDSSGQPVLVEPSFVDTLIEKAKEASDLWSRGIAAGSSVRVLLGSSRMLCGTVDRITGSNAEVRIALKSRAVRLIVPVRALQNLGTGYRDYFSKEAD